MVPLSKDLVRGLNNARHTPQVCVPAKKNLVTDELGVEGVCWHGTGKKYHWEMTMNKKAPIVDEALITVGYAYIAFCILIYNLRISFPDKDIHRAFIDICSCFCCLCIHPDLVGAFGFIIGALLFGPNAMIFGSVASATLCKPFRWTIAAISLSYFGRQFLVDKHKTYLRINIWSDPPDASVTFAPVKAYSKNPGIINADGIEQSSQHNIYVDTNLLTDTRRCLPFARAAAIEAIFVIMGRERHDCCCVHVQ